jgi:serine/threonine-protein kinase
VRDWRHASTKLPNLDDFDIEPTQQTDMAVHVPAQPLAPPRAGDILLGGYRVDGELGRGGMGVVYAATHATLGPVAIKVLLDPTASLEIRARFVIEANVSARLTGDHVCHVHDVAVDSVIGAPCIVMERLTGCDLDALLARRGPMVVPVAVDYVLQAIAGLAPAHALGVVHRDVKLSNLFLAEIEPGRARIKVLDFGISKAPGFGGSAHVTRLTKTGAIMGSPVYMAPEQVRNARSVDPRADVWSLGVVLYELLAGVPPFDGANVSELFMAILTDDPAPLRERRRDVPEALEHVVTIALKKEPERRFPDVSTLAQALVAFAPTSDFARTEPFRH